MAEMADFLVCPKCGKRVDEEPGTGETGTIPALVKTVVVDRKAEFPYCPHCGAVLGVLPYP